VLAFLGVVVILGALLIQVHRGQVLRTVPVRSDLPAGPSLDLKVERSGEDWQVGWNKNADALAQALGGHLTITDGLSRRELYLDANELQSGKITYAPMTDDVVVRLQLVTGDLARQVSESVRIIKGSVFHLPRQAETTDASRRASTTAEPVNHLARRPVSDRKGSSTEPRGSTVVAPGSSRQKSGIAMKIGAREARSGSDQIAADARPAVSRLMTVSGAPGLPPLELIPTKVPVPPFQPAAPLSELSRPEPAVRRQTKPGGDIDPAQLIARRDPVYPSRLRPANVSGLETQVDISEGNVHDVDVVKGNPLLVNAAVDAVRTWRYKPARLNGIEVETEATAVIFFKPN
jgi:outer membrane biosynthesis protein TonB